MQNQLIRITTGAICESKCLEWWEWGWIGIAAFMFFMWGITISLLLKEKRKNGIRITK